METDALRCGLIIVVAALIAAAAIWFWGRRHRKAPPTASASVYPRGETGSITYTYNVGRAAPAVWLRLRVEPASGQIHWTVTDPQGIVRWDALALGGQHLDQTRELAPMAGTWTLRLDLQEASGYYDLHWSVRRL